MSEEMVESFQSRTQTSDLVTYSGHAGLGASIKALASTAKFAAGKYQIFLLNGCNTFVYMDKYALRNAHHAANRDSSPYKYFDLLTNAMPSYFYTNATSNLIMVNALVEQKKNYREIMAEFDPIQRVNVVGEEDNLWPAPFE
jgi:hypothetical protein